MALAVAGVIVITLTARCGRGGFVNAPMPEEGADEPHAADAAPSTFGVPLTIPLAALVDLLDEAVPRSYGDLERFHDIPDRRVAVAFDLRRSPFTATMAADTARIESTIRYRLRASYDLPLLPDPKGSCGTGDDRERRLSVVLESPVTLDRQWRLRTRISVADLRPASDGEVDRCKMTFLGIDLTDEVIDGARAFLEAHLDDMDRLAADMDLRARFDGWWRTLDRPVELDDSLWLSMGPIAVQRGPIRGAGDSIRVPLELLARPTVVFGAKPDARDVGLPPLESGTFDARLDIHVDARAEYATGSRFLRERLTGYELRRGGRSLTIDSIRAYGIGAGRIALEVVVSGDLAGRLYATGRPSIDSESGDIVIPDLDYDVATRDLLRSPLLWLQAVGLLETLRTRARWPAAPAGSLFRKWLTRGLNQRIGDDLRLSGEVGSLRVAEVRALRDVLLVRISATGRASLAILDADSPASEKH